MKLTIRALNPNERMYTYSLSTQIEGQTGCIGYLRADMNSSDGFFSTWNCLSVRRTDEFKAELEAVINALRFNAQLAILANRKALAKFCHFHPEAMMPERGDYGFRVDSEQYAYMLRLNPNEGMYTMYCYCYIKDWLDRHIEKAKSGIRFVDREGKELFRVPDGGKVKIRYALARDEEQTYSCYYIDECHAEVGFRLYHIDQFAEMMERNGHKVEPVYSDLPDLCYSTLADGSNKIIILKRGEKGYHETDYPAETLDAAKELAQCYNSQLGVTMAQEAAMKFGSMFGFHVPGANPLNYDANGLLRKSVSIAEVTI